MRNCLKKFVVESCVRRRAHSSLAVLPARDDVKRSLSSSDSKVFTEGKYGAATTTRRSLGFANELSFFRDIGNRSVLHHQLPCSWTSKSFTSAKNLAGDENDDSPVTGKQSAQLTEKEFHAVSGDMLDQLQEKIETIGEELDIEGFEVDYSVSINFHGATTLAFLQFILKNKSKKTTKYFWFRSRAPINPLVAYVSGT
jgi:hypothetical protein